eukprot:2784429-Pleurochrysis_carterae.AAC.5
MRVVAVFLGHSARFARDALCGLRLAPRAICARRLEQAARVLVCEAPQPLSQSRARITCEIALRGLITSTNTLRSNS